MNSLNKLLQNSYIHKYRKFHIRMKKKDSSISHSWNHLTITITHHSIASQRYNTNGYKSQQQQKSIRGSTTSYPERLVPSAGPIHCHLHLHLHMCFLHCNFLKRVSPTKRMVGFPDLLPLSTVVFFIPNNVKSNNGLEKKGTVENK